MLNLATRARPYFGAVVLTCALLTAGGIYSATRMPSGVYPEVTFPRIAVVARVPDWDVTKMEVKVTRPLEEADRKSTRLNSSHVSISYAVFCLKKKQYDILLPQCAQSAA